MNFIKLIFAVTVLTGASAAARAQDTDANNMFSNWKSMQAYLSSQGVDPEKINWTQIDILCQGIKMYSGDTAYNKCSYQKALDLTLFANDKSQCTVQAKGAYPDGSINGRTDTLTETDKDGVTHTYQRTVPSVSTGDLEQLRSGAIVGCMQKLGWVSPDDWRSGKRSSYCQ